MNNWSSLLKDNASMCEVLRDNHIVKGIVKGLAMLKWEVTIKLNINSFHCICKDSREHLTEFWELYMYFQEHVDTLEYLAFFYRAPHLSTCLLMPNNKDFEKEYIDKISHNTWVHL